MTEASGVPIGLAIDGVNRHDCKMVETTIESIPIERLEPTEQEPQGMCLDKGYDSGKVRDLVKEFGYTTHIRSRSEEAQAIKREAGFKARRWVAERTHSWMNRSRRVLTRWGKKLRIIWACFILFAPQSRSAVAGYSDRLYMIKCGRCGSLKIT